MKVKRRGFFYKLGRTLARAKIAFSEGFYSPHIKIRWLHDRTYQKAGWYKRWTDKPYSRYVHNATFIAFIISFALFSVLQSFWPYLFNITKPREVIAGSYPVQWTQSTHFTSNGATNSNYNDATNPSSVVTTGDEVRLSSVSSGADMYLFWDGGAAPSGWSIVSDQVGEEFHNIFPRGNSSYGSSVGGSDSHTHNISGSTSIKTSDTSAIPGGTTLPMAGTHSHSISLGSTNSTDNLPLYRNLKVIKANGIPGSIPAGAIAVFDTINFPGGWERYAPQDDNFIRGSGDTNSGGSNTHNHSSFSMVTNTVATGIGQTGTYGNNVTSHSHSASGGPTSLNESQPPYIGVVLAKTPSGTENILGMIALFNGTPSSNWQVLSNDGNPFYHKFLKAEANYNETGGGVTSHTHDNFSITSDTFYSSNNIPHPNNAPGSTSHNHTVNGSFASVSGENHLPKYRDMVIARLTGPYASSGTLSSLKINADPNVISGGKKANWATVGWNYTTSDGAKYKTKFRTRTADTETGLASATWSSYYNATSPVASGSANLSQSPAYSQWLELEATLESTDRLDTPHLGDFTITYNTLENPVNGNTTIYRAGGTTLLKNSSGTDIVSGNTGGYTSESSIKITTTGLSCTSCGTSTGQQIEVEVKPVGTSFDGSSTILGTTPDDGTSTATVTGLSPGTSYHIRLRAKDAQGRQTTWIAYGANPAGDGSSDGNPANIDFQVEQNAPTGSVTINSGDSFTSSTSVMLAVTADDTGGSNLSTYELSNDGTNWSSPVSISGASFSDSNVAWTLTSGDDPKNVYLRVKDNAGNYSFKQPSGGIWQYQKPVTITGSTGGAQTDYQVLLSVNTSSLISAGKMDTEGDDIRFLNTSGTELPYYIESGINTSSTSIWVKVNDIPASPGTNKIYMIYGNPSATPASNHDNVFGSVSNIALNKSYSFTPGTSFYPDSGGQLTNGLIREETFGGTEATTGWRYTNMSATIDLASTQFVDSYKGYFGGGGGGSINIPAGVTIKTSTDNVNWSTVASGSGYQNIEQWLTFNSDPIQARYVKFEVNVNGEWIMIGDLEVYNSGRKYVDPEPTYGIGTESSNILDDITLDTSRPAFDAGTITAPSGGEQWAGGSTHNITWDNAKITDAGSGLSTSPLPITIKFSSNSGTSWSDISGAASIANSGSYSWHLPNSTCVNTCRIGIIARDALGNVNSLASGDPNYDADAVSALFSLTADSDPPIWNSQTTLDVSPKFIDGQGYTWTKGTTNLSWDPGATDAQSGIDKYQILLDPGATLKEDNIPTTSKSTTFTEGTYTWYVNAVNGATLSANTKDDLDPSRTMTIKVDATLPTASLSALPLTGHGYTATNSNLVNLSVSNIVDSGSGYKEVSFSNDGNLWSLPQSATSFSSWDLTDIAYGGSGDKGTKNVYLKIRDNVGNENGSISTSIVYEDTAPTNPTTVSASVGTNANSTYSNGSWTGNSTADVSWSGATDTAPSSGIYRYEVYESQDDGSYSLLDTVASSPKVAESLIDGHNYKYLIRTIDAAGNASNHTIGETPGSVDLPDITNPEPPQSFSASGTDTTVVQIDWNTAPENSTSHGGKADSYVVNRTDALGSSEPADENGSCSINTYGNNIDTVSFEESPQYKGSELYQVVDSSIVAEQWYYYRARASDEGSNNSTYVCYKARGNKAPIVNQNDISVSVSNGHTADTVAIGDVVTIGFKASDEDGRADLDFGTGNASQNMRIQNGTLEDVLNPNPPYSFEVTQNPPTSTKQNDGGNSNGYVYTYAWTVPGNANFGTYTASINVKDTVAQGNPGENLHNVLKQVNFKIPATSPANFVVAGQSSTQLSLTWDKSASGGVASYKIYRSTSEGDVESQTPQTKTLAQLTDNGTTWSYIDSGLDYNVPYYYKIRAVDVSANDGAFSALASKTTPTPAVPSDSAVKLIDASTVRQAPEVSENRFLLTWDAPVNDAGNNTTNNAFSKYVIEKSENAGPFSTVSETTNLFFVDIGLSNIIDYTYRVRTKDTFNNLSRPDLSPTRTGQPGAKPSVTVTSVETSTSTARIKWTATQEAETQIVYSANQSEVNNPDSTPLTSGVGGRRDAGTQHNVLLTGLSPNTTYYYKVVSRNVIGYANDFTIQSFNTKNFTIQHTKSSDVSTTTTTATINWRTGEVPSDSFVEYQLQANYGPAGVAQTAGNGVIVPANGLHTIYITGLRSNSRYSYKIRSMDEGKYVVLSGLDYFETKPFDTSQFTLTPSSTNIAEQNITATSARIIWSTAIATTTWVDYGTSPGAYGQSAGNDNYNTQHVIELVNLTPGTTYYYRVRGKDSNDVEYVSPEYHFTAILKPKVSNVVVREVGPYQVTITWETNVATDTVLDYGKNASYGNRQGIPESVKLHSMTIKNLEDNTTYHYRIVVRDQFGNESMTSDANFATPIDKEGPKIRNVKIDIMPMGESDETAQAIISWSTSKPATTKVEYDEGVITNKLSKSSIEDKNLNGSHTVIIKELAPATTYRFRIVSRDKRGNETKSQDYTLVTPTKEKSIWQLIVKSIEETFAWVKNIGNFFKNLGKKVK